MEIKESRKNSRRAYGSPRITKDIQAIGRRRPSLRCIFHSDRGVQYASTDFRNALNAYGFIRSMSRKGNCCDNAVAESFFEYIEMFYNRNRRHSALGYRSPASFEPETMAA